MKRAARWLGAILGAIVGFLLLAGALASANDTITYSYDALGRLVAVSTAGGINDGQAVSTSFDPAGNRTNYSVSGVPTANNLAIGNASATEGGNLTFTVTRTGTTSTAVSASWATANGTAVSGSDYTAASGTVSFASGETSKTITVATINDSVVESAETMTVTLSAPSANTTITTATGTGTINDNDLAWSSSLTSGTATGCVGYCTYYGYVAGTTGSMTNTTYNGYTVTGVYTNVSPAGTYICFSLSGGSVPPNSGWTSITIPGVGTFSRASATYSTGTNSALWTWTNSSHVTSGTVSIQ